MLAVLFHIEQTSFMDLGRLDLAGPIDAPYLQASQLILLNGLREGSVLTAQQRSDYGVPHANHGVPHINHGVPHINHGVPMSTKDKTKTTQTMDQRNQTGETTRRASTNRGTL